MKVGGRRMAAKRSNGKNRGNKVSCCGSCKSGSSGFVGNILGLGIVFAVISQVVHGIGGWLGYSYYADSQYSAIWSRLFMPTSGAPSSEFFIYSILLSFIAGIIYALVYWVIKDGIKN